MKKYFQGILLVLVFGTLSVAFNNCGGDASSSTGSSLPLDIVDETITCEPTGQVLRLSKLSETCFGKIMENEESALFQNFTSYIPNYPLATVIATKKSRWIYLPEGTAVDNSDPDNWVYPVGTIFWKEFASEDVKIETRMLEKVTEGEGIEHWKSYTYYWTMDQTDAVFFAEDEFPTGPELAGQYAYDNYTTRDAGGTITSYDYKVPNRQECLACHSGAKDVVLGFTGFQLLGANSGLRLNALESEGWLSTPVTASYVISGSETNRRVVGLMQSNCAGCHSPFNVDPTPVSQANFKLSSGITDTSQMEPIRTLIDNGKMIPGDPDNSRIVQRLENQGGSGFMPPTIDGIPQQHYGFTQLVRQWISEM